MKREPILLGRLKRPGTQGKLIIGITGTHSGAGVTHLAVLMATYFSEYLGLRTAFLECAPKNEIQYIKNHFFKEYDESADAEDNFSVHRVTFYKNRNVQGIPEIMGDQFDCVILDFGIDVNKYKGEFLRCDKKIIVSSLAVWKVEGLRRFIHNTGYIKNSDQWIYGIPFVQDKVINKGRKELNVPIYGIPYEPDPFVLSNSTIQFFQKIL
jgi:hypothetical protein